MPDTYKLRQPATPEPDNSTSPPAGNTRPAKPPPGRLVSLDAYRGFIMTMLAASGFGIAALAKLAPDDTVWQTWDYDTFQRLRFHFSHPAAWESISGWMGVSFWDLIQPAFMFMVGVAMPFSWARRSAMGRSSGRRWLHIVFRAVLLTLMGVFLQSLTKPQTFWIFTNVLSQIGLGYCFACLLLGRTAQTQVAAIAAILVGYWGFFMLNPPPDNYDYAAVEATAESREIYTDHFAPWSKNANAGHSFDVWLLNKLRLPQDAAEDTATTAPGTTTAGESAMHSPGVIRQWWFSFPDKYEYHAGGYVTLNFIPSIATMLLGVLCGQLLMSEETARRKLLLLLLWGSVCAGLGVLAHHTVCPIVKRIWTPSWTLFSGGYVIWMLAGFYFLFDMLPLKKAALPLVVVGMNSIVMYLMGQMMRPWVISKVTSIHFGRVLQTYFGVDPLSDKGMGAMLAPTSAFVVFWLIAFWMYRNRYFVRI